MTSTTTSTTTNDTTTSTFDRYCALSDAFGGVVDSLPAGAWDAPSACEGWAGRDVLDHVVGTQRDFFAARGVALGADSTREDDPVARWQSHDDEVRRIVTDPAVTSMEYDSIIGPTTVGETLVNFFGFDLIVHRWDLARSADLDERFTEAELDAIESALPAFGDHLYDEGVCKPALPVGPDADRQVAVLARLGRAARG